MDSTDSIDSTDYPDPTDSVKGSPSTITSSTGSAKCYISNSNEELIDTSAPYISIQSSRHNSTDSTGNRSDCSTGSSNTTGSYTSAITNASSWSSTSTDTISHVNSDINNTNTNKTAERSEESPCSLSTSSTPSMPSTISMDHSLPPSLNSNPILIPVNVPTNPTTNSYNPRSNFHSRARSSIAPALDAASSYVISNTVIKPSGGVATKKDIQANNSNYRGNLKAESSGRFQIPAKILLKSSVNKMASDNTLGGSTSLPDESLNSLFERRNSSYNNKHALSDTPVASYTNSPKDPGEGSGRNSPHANIPPLTLPARRATTLDVPGLTRSKVSPDGLIAARDVESKLVIVMVGLPARGKSYVTKKLCRYLNWQQHNARIFNVGNTRRKANQHVGPAPHPLPDSGLNLKVWKEDRKASIAGGPGAAAAAAAAAAAEANKVINEPPPEEHNADFFSPDNPQTSALREQWAMDTLDALLDYILEENGSVGILDATNTTVARRKRVLDKINERSGGRLKVLFLESICTKSEIIDSNIRLKLSGPDYKDVDPEVAINDFVERMHNYEKAYQTIGPEEEANDDIQYIKMIDVGRKVVCYNIKGFLAGQAVFFLLNFNLAERQIWITRHGESEDNATGRIGGDAPLTERGKKFSATLTRFIDYQKKEFRKKQLQHYADRVQIVKKNRSQPTTPLNEPEEPSFCVWTSMLQRSIETAKWFDEETYDIKEMRMLNELGAGICDGMTYQEISEQYPKEYDARMEDKITYRYPGIGGESYLDVINRLRPVIVEVERMQDNVLIVGHRVVARVLLAYFMDLGREAIGDLEVPLHTLYVLEPKPYGVDWAIYEYNEQLDWFFLVPKSSNKEPAMKLTQDISSHRTRQFSVLPTAPSLLGGASSGPSLGSGSGVSAPRHLEKPTFTRTMPSVAEVTEQVNDLST